MLCLGLVCYASPKHKDTIYSNINTLMKEVRTTKKKTATYFFIHKEGDEDKVKLRIDLKQIDCEIPLYKSATFDLKKLMALKEENLTDAKQKLAAFDAKSREKIALEKELSQLNAGLNKLMALDSLSRDSLAIDSIQKLKDQKAVEVSNKKKEAKSLYQEYDGMMDNLMGNLRTNYRQRLTAAFEEAYQKIENEETKFASVDDDAKIWDIRLDLLKVDATREMLVPRRVNNQNITEKVTAGKQYYVLHFAEFGTMFEEEKVKKVFSAIKLWEFHLNPYLVDKQFGLVCDDQNRTQHYINSIVDYKNYSGSLAEEEEFADNNPLAVMELRKFSGGNPQEHVGKFGCVRYSVPSSCSHSDAAYVIEGKNKAHMGIDILAPINTSIYSAVNGIAYVYPGEISGYGKTISVKGKLKNLKTGKEEDIYVMYAHLNKISIENETEVKVGDVLGGTGITGNGNTSNKDERHLHLEILTQKWPSSSKGFSIRKPPLDYFKIINH